MGGCTVKKSVMVLPLTLTALLGIAQLAAIVVRVFLPQLIFPPLEITGMVLLCLVALLSEHYLAPRARHNYLVLAIFGALLFGLLPFAAGFALWQRALVLGGAGAVILVLTTFVFTSIRHRLESGPAAPLAPAACALCLYLASQAFRGILL